MAIEERFTELPNVTAAQMTDIICAVQGYISPSNLGLSVQESLQQIYNLFQSNIILFNAGNPNGAIAGTTYQLCWDTVNTILYVCTLSGNAATAVWTKSISLTAGTDIGIVQSGNNITVNSTLTNTITTPWTPIFTFDTPGDLSVVYTTQTGLYAQVGSLIIATCTIDCVPTYTTASGNFQISGLPVPSNPTVDTTFTGTASLSGVYTIGTATWVISAMFNGNNHINLFADKSNSASTPFTTTSFTSASGIGMTVSISYLQ